MKLIFDIETDGFLSNMTRVHSLVILNHETQEFLSFCDHGGYPSLQEGVKLLQQADVLIGHNIISFDIPALEKVYGVEFPGKRFDTLNASRLIWAQMPDLDRLFKTGRSGGHSLEDWGYRLGILKGTFGKQTDWKEWSPSMQKYCEQDVRVTAALYEKIEAKKYSKRALDLEMQFQYRIFLQEQEGIPFNHREALKLAGELKVELEEREKVIVAMVPPLIKESWFTPKANNAKKGYQAGVPVKKTEMQPFKPSSRTMIIEHLKKRHQWIPSEFTEKGNPKVDNDVLRGLPFPECSLLAEYMEGKKILGYLQSGDKAWINYARNGRIYGRVVTNGAVTGRCTHFAPNLAQVPSVRAYKGKECRALFHSGEGWMVGADASGLELRCLAHYMAAYDNGAYGRVILEGDIHTENQKAAGLETRDQAKTFIYAFLYGAGDEKIGSIVEPLSTGTRKKEVGKKLRGNFLQRLPALKKLIADVQGAAKMRGYLIGLDGRHLHVRSEHAALNTLLQGAGAIVMKQAFVNFWNAYAPFKTLKPALNVHDEFQIICYGSEAAANAAGEGMVQAIRYAGKDFEFRCPLDGEYRVGKNWAQTH